MRGDVSINGEYSVYLHVFPNGKKYVGCTSKPVRERWDGGLGYSYNKRMFPDILRFGWENIRHYVLCDGLDKEAALAVETTLIKELKTYQASRGYNIRVDSNLIPDVFVLPEIGKRKVCDAKNISVEDRYSKRIKARGLQSNKCKPIRLIETGEVFPSATAAANNVGGSAKLVSRAARAPGGSSGVCEICVEESGVHMFVPAHWEYINTNSEEKDEEHD